MQEIIRHCEQLAPLSYAASWDNVGLIIGDPRAKARGAVISLDLTDEVLDVAERERCNLAIVHHPPLFEPIRMIDLSKPQGKLLAQAIKSGIAVYAMHTNLDSAPRGLNRYVAELLGLKTIRFAKTTGGEIYCIGSCDKKTGAVQFAATVKKTLGLKGVRLYGGGTVRRVAVCTGSGGGVLAHAAANGADALVTGEVRHHQAMESRGLGISLLEAGHAGTERPMVALVGGYLKKKMANSAKRTKIVCLRIEEPYENI